MKQFPSLSSALLLGILAVSAGSAAAQAMQPLPSPLSLGDVIRIASARRDEIKAARARIRAGEARPTIVSALADPRISPSLGHLPFMLGGADVRRSAWGIELWAQSPPLPFRPRLGRLPDLK